MEKARISSSLCPLSLIHILRFLEKQDYDLIVLDVNLPDGNGFDICREVKERRPGQGKDMLIVSEKGMGKRTSMEEFTKQNRGGKGVKCYKITEKTGKGSI